MDVLVAHQGSGPGDAAVRCIEQADFGFLVGRNRRHHLHTHGFPGGPTGAKVVFNHPLDKALAHDRHGIGPAGGGQHAGRHIGGGARCDAVHHGVGAGGVGVDPGQQFGLIELRNEAEQTGAHAFAVVAQVVAVEQGHRSGLGLHACAQHGGQRPINGAACGVHGRGAACRCQVGCYVWLLHIKLVVRVQVVARLGHGERDDAGGGVGSAGYQTRQAGFKRNHLPDGGDARVAVYVSRSNSLQRVGTALRSQCGQGVGHVGADVAARQTPVRVARRIERVHVIRLVGAVK